MQFEIQAALRGLTSLRRRSLWALGVVACTLSVALAGQPPLAAAAAPRTFYLDCTAGNDANSGQSPSLAWKSLGKANGAALTPGDSLWFRRDCVWTGTLRATWVGTAAAPIVIGAYGAGALPKIQNSAADLLDAAYTSVDITGAYLIIQDLQTTVVNPPVDAGCGNNPIGFFVGFNFRNPNNTADGGSHNIVRFVQATHAMAGVHFNNNTHHDQVRYSTFTDNNVMLVLTPKAVNATDDIGAWGILLKGQNHEIAYNYLSRNNALCTYDTATQGNSIEVYEARDSVIHHNIAVGDRVFSELGGTAIKADSITYAYNLVISAVNDARFVVARGAGNPFGPTNHTSVLNNTVYFTGAHSQALVCSPGCSPTILTAANNIFWAEEKAAYADAAFTESNNVYWNSSGTPFVQFVNFSMSPTSRIANPLFTTAGASNFKLQAGSPAIDMGQLTGWTIDLDGEIVPQASLPDAGAYEYAPASVFPPGMVFDNVLFIPQVANR